jgi:(p)ppGpp synthase/HD superfamily hydrolase
MMNDRISKSEHFAQKIFNGLIRKSGETVYRHSLNVRKRLEDIGVQDEDVLIAAIFHDVNKMQDSHLLTQVKELFGEKVFQLLYTYKKFHDTDIEINSPGNLNRDFIIQTYFNMAEDPNVLLILLADKTENSNTIYALDKEDRADAAEKALYVYAPLCRLVGLFGYSLELEKNGFMILFPSEYFKIKKFIKSKSVLTKNMLENLRQLLYEYLEKNNLKVKISYRIKSEYSIFEKSLRYKNKGMLKGDYNNLYDIAAMRILVNSVEECYLAEDLLNRIWQSEPSERDDYIVNPKPGGYRSLHNVFYIDREFEVEIQIKTFAMHEENEYGNASHLFYKYGSHFRKYLKNNPDWLKNSSISHLINEDKLGYFSNFVYVFTPKGDILELPRGATALDFAYHIHEDIGNRCLGAIVNKKIEKLSYVLNDGDKIEIKISNTKNNVNNDWLEIVNTKYAKRCVRKAVRGKKNA